MEYQTGVKKKDTLEDYRTFKCKDRRGSKSQWCSAYNP